MNNKELFKKYIESFLTQNKNLNLISKNDETFLWEKHIFDSLSIELFFEKYKPDAKQLLDIGTGGGFPALPIAIAYPNIKVTALDSIRKKINAVENIKNELNITNLLTICGRAENLSEKFDIITSRAVASLDKISQIALPLLKHNGYFIAYKSRKAPEEISSAEKTLKKYNAKIKDIIEYKLPLDENYTRNLIVITR